MSANDNQYDLDIHVAEIYDLFETEQNDVELLRRLIGATCSLRILEPFCGTGRLLLPLAQDGHELVGMDAAHFMLARLRQKLSALPAKAQERVQLIEADVLEVDWPSGFDVVVLGGNCFYELASAKEQETCIAQAARSLRPDGYLFLDNDHMEGLLDESWRRPGRHPTIFPQGTCADGVRLEGFSELLWFDAERRLARSRRSIRLTYPDGRVEEKSYVQQKHPPSTEEMSQWLVKHGFVVEQLFGDKTGSPYAEASPRAVFWARRVSSTCEGRNEHP
jgi:SAM-dependent methyltransferase